MVTAQQDDQFSRHGRRFSLDLAQAEDKLSRARCTVDKAKRVLDEAVALEREAFEALESLRRSDAARIYTAFQPMNPENDPRRILRDVARYHELSEADLTGTSRRQDVVEARYAAIEAIRIKYPDFGVRRLGRMFNRDHSTIAYALKTIAARQSALQENRKIAA